MMLLLVCGRILREAPHRERIGGREAQERLIYGRQGGREVPEPVDETCRSVYSC